jgi:hypothetical protein
MSLSVKRQLEEAAVTAFAVACAYIFVSSLALLFLPDAGRASPSNLLVAGGVFVVAFLASAARRAHAERVVSWAAVADRDVTARAIAARPFADSLGDGAISPPAVAPTAEPRPPGLP